MTRKIIIASVVGSLLLAAGAVFAVDAVRAMPPKMVEIGPQGKALLRGTVKSTTATTVTVTSWGGDWVVNTTDDTSKFMAGDFVGVQGTVSTAAAWTIDASLVRNWTAKREAVTEKKETIKEKVEQKTENVQQRIDSILEQIKKIQAQLQLQAQTGQQ